MPQIEVLDGKDKDGLSAFSMDDDEAYGEEGEVDMEEDEELAQIIEKLDPETR